MRLTVNGEQRDTEHRTLAALWAAETEHLRDPAEAGAPDVPGDEAAGAGTGTPSRRGFAIALNGDVVRAARWDDTDVNEGDRVEIIRAVAGG